MRSYAKMAMINAARNEGNGGGMRGEHRMADDRRMRYEGGESRYEGGRDTDMEMRRYKNGRFAPKNEGGARYGMDEYDAYSEDPEDAYQGTRNRIGFAAKSNVVDFPHGKMSKGNKPRMSGHFTREMAEEWTEGMKNKDKSRGAHWDLEKVSQVMKQYSLHYDKYEFWAVLNAIYSDFCEVLDKHGVSNMEFYIDLAKAWIDDEDAVEDKAAAYFECVVK